MYVTILRTLVLYLVIVIGVRMMGKRHLGELQPSELVVTILISNIATLPIENVDVPILAGVLPILLLVCFEVVVSFISMKSIRARKIFSGNPIAIIKDGRIDQKLMADLRFSVDDLLEELRVSGVFDLRDVDYAVVETNGQLSVYQKFSARSLTPSMLNIPSPAGESLPPQVVVSDGVVNAEALTLCNLSRQWLDDQLAKSGYRLGDVFIMTTDRSADCHIVPKEQKKRRAGRGEAAS